MGGMARAITHRHDLRTGTSYWQSRPAPRLPANPLKRDLETGVLVVGAGISGALIAEALSETHRVVVVDRRGPARGSTPASTALVEYEIDIPLTQLARQIGADRAARAWRRSHLALHGLRSRTRALGIRCDAVGRDTLYLAGNVLNADGLRAEADARRDIGIEAVVLPRPALRERFGIDRPAAILSHGDFAVDPRRLTMGYLQQAIRHGARLHAPVDVLDVTRDGDRWVAATGDGPTIRADAVIFATGYEFLKFVPLDGQSIASTWAIATAPQPRRLWPGQAMIWEASDPYLYARTTPDGRVIAGGEDEDFKDEEKRDALIAMKSQAIADKLAALFPGLDTTPAFAWTGSFGSSHTGLPLIGVVPGRPNVWAVLGFGGNGITYSRIAADIIRAALRGETDPDADLFAF